MKTATLEQMSEKLRPAHTSKRVVSDESKIWPHDEQEFQS